MCFGGGKSVEYVNQPAAVSAAAVAPPPSPTPTGPEPAEVTASKLADKKRRQLAAIKFGISSTVKTSGAGDQGPINLLTPAVMGAGLKERLGQ